MTKQQTPLLGLVIDWETSVAVMLFAGFILSSMMSSTMNGMQGLTGLMGSTSNQPSPNTGWLTQLTYLSGIIIAFAVGFVIYVVGLFVVAYSQGLVSKIDTLVLSSPYLTEEDRITLLGLKPAASEELV